MKKFFALLLAVSMLSTFAVAASGDLTNRPDQDSGSVAQFNPGDVIYIYSSDFALKGKDSAIDAEGKASFTSEYFSVVRKKFEKGSDLVESVSFNDSKERLEIKLKDNYNLETPRVANLIIEAIEIKAKKDTATFERNKTYELMSSVIASHGSILVGWDVTEVEIVDGGKVTPVEGFLKFVQVSGGDSYGTMSFDFNSLAYGEVRVYDGDKVNIQINEDVDTDIVKAYPDAELRFVNFEGNPTFSSNMDLEIYAEEGEYIYEVHNGKLYTSSLKWDEDVYAFVGKTRTLGSYVISDTKIDTVVYDGSNDSSSNSGSNSGSSSTNPSNPNTGANDVMSVVAALVAIGAVSAAALSLKKSK